MPPLVAAAFKHSLAYRFNIFFYAVGTLLQIVLMASIWSALDSQGALQATGGRAQWITYSVVAFSLSSLFSMFATTGWLTERIKKGDIAMELVRPVGIQSHLFQRYLGSGLFRLIFAVGPFLVIGALVYGLIFPPDPAALALFLLSAFLGYCLNFSIWFLFSLLTFYSLDNSGLFLLFLALVNLFSGLYVPLWAYPPGLREVAEWLPFASVYAVPMDFWLHKPTWEMISRGLLGQAVWLLLLGGGGYLAWRGIQKHVEIQGG